MVKINLLAEGKRPVVARKSKAPLLGGASRELGNLLLVAGLAIGLLAAGGWYLWVNGKLKQKEREVAAAPPVIYPPDETFRIGRDARS